MTTVSDLQNAPVANANWIDALLNSYPAWNYIVAPLRTENTLYYTFSLASGTDTGGSRPGLQTFNTTQQIAAREIMAHAAAVTGITFVETLTGSAADIHFASYDIAGSDISGITYSYHPYYYNSQDIVTSFTPSVYVYLDNGSSFLQQNSSPRAGTLGYETLLHEVGHALGLKHPFAGSTTLSPSLDNSSNTVMSYTRAGGTYYSTFREYDLAALAFLYGGDGLGGAWGVGSSGYYYQGTSANDTFTASGGRHTWVGLGGTDAVNYPAPVGGVLFSRTADSAWLNITGSGFDDRIAASIEQVGFQSGTSMPVSMVMAAVGTTAQRIYAGTSTNDVVVSTSGNDLFFIGDAGTDVFDGGGGIDTALLNLNRAQVQIQRPGAGHQVTSAYGGDTLNNIERLHFNDRKLALDLDGAAGNTVKIIGAVFGNTYVTASDNATNAAIVGIGLGLFDSGMTMEQVAEIALGSGLFPGGRSNANVVNQLFNNVVGRLPSVTEHSNFVVQLETGAYTQASLAVLAAEIDLNTANINIVGLAGSGIEYA